MGPDWKEMGPRGGRWDESKDSILHSSLLRCAENNVSLQIDTEDAAPFRHRSKQTPVVHTRIPGPMARLEDPSDGVGEKETNT